MTHAPIEESFAVLDASDADERRRWCAVWEAWPGREVFAHPGYVALETRANDRACLALLQCDGGTVLYPFILRTLTDHPAWSAELGSITDITAPYGYGGHHVFGADEPLALVRRFWEAFGAWAREQLVVSEFVRFSLFASTHESYPGDIEERQSNVVRSLLPPMDDIWMDVDHKVRKNVKKARRSGIEIVLDTGERLDEFLDIYAHTMDRRDAHERYYFGRDYFTTLQASLPGQFAYFHALLAGRVVSTELVLVSANSVYSFLGGTRGEAFEHRPNDLLKYAIVEWARAQGKEHFVLGGGYTPDDGIFRYKLAFAPEGRMRFFVGRRVLMPDVYDTLVRRRQREAGTLATPSAFFPAYRA